MIKQGDKFHKLTVVKQVESDKNWNRVFECVCDCGNVKNVTYSKLTTGHTKSCGCMKSRIADNAGVRRGKLVALEYVGKRNGNVIWKVRCDCGNIVEMSNSQFKHNLSCGCLNDEKRRETVREKIGFIEGTCISSINKSTLSKINTSGVRGVSYDSKRKRWVAQITFKRKNYLLGRFVDKDDAIKARKKGEEKYFNAFLEQIKKD